MAIISYILSISDLSFERYFERVFEPVSFDLKAGSLLLVTGANGCGKTTLLRLLAGLLEPSEGEIDCKGQALYAGHVPAIKDDLSVEENIRFWMHFMGTRGSKPEPEILKQIIGKIGLTPVAQQQGRTLSAGQRKRCSLSFRVSSSDFLVSSIDHAIGCLFDCGFVVCCFPWRRVAGIGS